MSEYSIIERTVSQGKKRLSSNVTYVRAILSILQLRYLVPRWAPNVGVTKPTHT